MAIEEFITRPSTVSLEQCAPRNKWAPQDTYFVPENKTNTGGVDCDLFADGDLPPDKSITANHSDIYFKGKLSQGSKINLRQGFVSATSLDPGSEIVGGIALIISNHELSRFSENIKRPSSSHPLMLVVPESKRADVFDFVTTRYGHDPRYYEAEGRQRMLKEIAEEFPHVPIQVVSWGHARQLSV